MADNNQILNVTIHKTSAHASVGITFKGSHPEIVVTNVKPASLCAKAGMEIGMLIQSINGVSFQTAKEVGEFLASMAGDLNFVLHQNIIEASIFKPTPATLVGVAFINRSDVGATVLSKIKPSSPLLGSAIQPGMILVRINGVSFSGGKQAAAYLKECQGKVTFEARKNYGPTPKQTASATTSTQQAQLEDASTKYFFLALLFVAWVFWAVAVFHCSFLKISPTYYTSYEYNEMESFGLFSAAIYEDNADSYNDETGPIYACVRYSQDFIDELDGPAIASRVFGSIGFIFHSLTIFMAVRVLLFSRGEGVPSLWGTVQFLVAASLFCSLLMFTIYASDFCEEVDDIEVKCVPGSGGIVAVINIAILFVAVICSCNIPVPKNPLFRRWENGDNSVVRSSAPVAAPRESAPSAAAIATPAQNRNATSTTASNTTPVKPPTEQAIGEDEC